MAPLRRATSDLGSLYRRKVEALEAALAGGEDSAEAMEMVRIMIDRVVLTPSPAGAELDADLHGELAGVLAVCEGAAQMCKPQSHKRPGSFEPGRQVSVVAGAGFGLYRTCHKAPSWKLELYPFKQQWRDSRTNPP